jgi:glycosyltransferase involved in cell wall biosynthesis
MARLGINPARKKQSLYKPHEVTVAMLVYIPSLEGYFQQRLEILKVSIQSLLSNTKTAFDFLVLDNGSSENVRSYLKELNDQGRINYLILSSRNLGVEGGLKVLANSALGKYIAYTNDDVFYYPGWLQEHLKIMNTFPDVGMVSGAPVGIQSTLADDSLIKLMDQNLPELTVSRTARNPQWEEDWAKSTGRNIDEHQSFIKETPHTLLDYKGVMAVGLANHYQFIAPVSVIKKALPDKWRGNLMGGVVELDRTVDRMGYLRLSTKDRYTRHIGNALDDDFKKVTNELVGKADISWKESGSRSWITKVPGVRFLLSRVYHWLFRILYNLE